MKICWRQEVDERLEEQWQLLKWGWPSEKQNLVLSIESTPMKDDAPQLARPRSQFNSEQPIKLPDAPPLCSFLSLCCGVKRMGWKLVDGWRWMGCKRSNNNFCHEGWPSEKQNLILSRESYPTKDETSPLTRPRSQFNSEQPIKSPDAPPPCLFCYPHCYVNRMGWKFVVDRRWMRG